MFFTTIQKFNQEVETNEGYTKRDDIIVITDEAHRTQYGTLALNMRNALPNANFIGFTGTPYNKDDYFADVIFDYNIRTAVNEKYIKDINPIIGIETDDGEMQWTTERRFAVVLNKHIEISNKYAYKRNGKKQLFDCFILHINKSNQI